MVTVSCKSIFGPLSSNSSSRSCSCKFCFKI
jgi:hypothetical protein